VLKRVDSGEADATVTFFAPQLGKVTALAKGVRRPKSKRAAYLEPLCHSIILLGKGRNLDFVREAEGVNAFLPLREDLERLSCTLCIAELVDQFIPVSQEERGLFQLILSASNNLCHCLTPEAILHYFKLHLLGYVGYKPELQHCVVCHCRLISHKISLSPRVGGITCLKCATGQAPLVSVNALKVMRFLQRGDVTSACRLKLNSRLSAELRQVLRHYIEYLLERELRSNRFLDTLEEFNM